MLGVDDIGAGEEDGEADDDDSSLSFALVFGPNTP